MLRVSASLLDVAVQEGPWFVAVPFGDVVIVG